MTAAKSSQLTVRFSAWYSFRDSWLWSPVRCTASSTAPRSKACVLCPMYPSRWTNARSGSALATSAIRRTLNFRRPRLGTSSGFGTYLCATVALRPSRLAHRDEPSAAVRCRSSSAELSTSLMPWPPEPCGGFRIHLRSVARTSARSASQAGPSSMKYVRGTNASRSHPRGPAWAARVAWRCDLAPSRALRFATWFTICVSRFMANVKSPMKVQTNCASCQNSTRCRPRACRNSMTHFSAW